MYQTVPIFVLLLWKVCVKKDKINENQFGDQSVSSKLFDPLCEFFIHLRCLRRWHLKYLLKVGLNQYDELFKRLPWDWICNLFPFSVNYSHSYLNLRCLLSMINLKRFIPMHSETVLMEVVFFCSHYLNDLIFFKTISMGLNIYVFIVKSVPISINCSHSYINRFIPIQKMHSETVLIGVVVLFPSFRNCSQNNVETNVLPYILLLWSSYAYTLLER